MCNIARLKAEQVMRLSDFIHKFTGLLFVVNPLISNAVENRRENRNALVNIDVLNAQVACPVISPSQVVAGRPCARWRRCGVHWHQDAGGESRHQNGIETTSLSRSGRKTGYLTPLSPANCRAHGDDRRAYQSGQGQSRSVKMRRSESWKCHAIP